MQPRDSNPDYQPAATTHTDNTATGGSRAGDPDASIEIGQLQSRKCVKTEHLIGWLGHIIVELQRGLEHDTAEATGELSDALMASLRPRITVAEISGARRILELVLTALPDYGPMEAHS